MRNSIFKGYAKRILRNEAFVSVLIVFVLALGIIGTSYALYMDVDTDTDYQLVEVGDLSIGFDNGDNTINLSGMTPTDDDIAVTLTDNIYSFYIYNTGTYTANYTIKLEPVTDGDVPNQVEPTYINYQICRDSYENCTNVKNLGDSTTIYQDELAPKKTTSETNPSAYYFLRMWIKSDYTQTESKTIKYKVVIEAKNASGTYDSNNTLAYALLNDSRVTINNNPPVFNGVATDELGLFKAEDDYGISYYYRGAQQYNYVSFAGFTWRVVRINGDGTIRLILDGTLDKICGTTNSTVCTTSAYNELNNDNAYLGYMYGLAGTTTDGNRCLMLENDEVVDKVSTYATEDSCENAGGVWTTTAYEATHANIKSSTVKETVDNFYETFLKENYSNYLADSIFCGDKTLIGGNGTGTNRAYYSSRKKLFSNIYYNEEILSPTIKCEEKFSTYTVAKNLKYPIALLSGDELVMAGAYSTEGFEVTNTTYYLYNSTLGSTYWTMSSDGFVSYVYAVISGYNINPMFSVDIALLYGVRPVINLRADILKAGGDGTSDTPYTVKLS